MNIDLKAIFGKFVGKEVPMTETPYELELKNLGITHKGVNIEPTNPNDPVLAEMKKAAQDHGLRLRVFWPSHATGTMDVRSDRVNARIEKGEDGKWRVADKFRIG